MSSSGSGRVAPPIPPRSTQAPGGAALDTDATNTKKLTKAQSSSKSPPPKTPTPPIASSSLASFYGDLKVSDSAPPAASEEGHTSHDSAEPHIDTADDDDGNDDAAEVEAVSASDFYALAASRPSPVAAAAPRSNSNKRAADAASPHQLFLQTSLPTPTISSVTPTNASTAAAAEPDSPVVSRVPSVLATIAAKFDHPPIDLAASNKRVLIKEGMLNRQATFKQVERFCYLFNDLFIVTEPLSKATGGSGGSASAATSPVTAKLVMKQVVSLDVATLLPGKKNTSFVIDNPEKPLTFDCSRVSEAREWIDALGSAINAYQSLEPKQTIASDAHETLFTAISKQDDELLLYLLSERGDDPNQPDQHDMTPLHRAVLNDFTAGVTLLLSHDADMTRQNRDGKSSVHLAALCDAYAILLIFLSRQPAIDQMLDMDGRSPLWDLVQGPHTTQAKTAAIEEAEQALSASPTSSAGPAASPLSKRGRPKKPALLASPSSSAFKQSDTDGSSSEDEDDRVLSPASKDLRTRESIIRNSWKNLCECLNVMIDQGVDIDCKDKSGRTLLMHLASLHSHESLQLLLSHGASTSLIDDADGCGVLHYAVCRELTFGLVEEHDLADVIKTVQTLLQAGVCPNLRDHHGNTALHLCKSLPVAGCLLVHGARVELKNEAGEKAIAYFDDLAAQGDLNDPLNALREAKEQWTARPDTYLPAEEDLEANSWLHDELSDCCLLCNERFTLTRRRHHCRRCGMLVDAACSSKRFTNPRTKESGLRACDGCYNHMAHLYLKYARVQRRLLAKRRAEEVQLAKDRAEINAALDASHAAFVARQAAEEERIAAKMKRVEEAKTDARRSVISSSSQPAANRSASSRAEGTNAQMQQNRQLALERGEKLGRLEDKAARMEADAENFASLAAKLKEKQKNSWF